MKDKISALIDNELSPAERERELDKLRPGSDELEVWERYARIRAELRGEMPTGEGFRSGALADRIAESLRSEPTQFAPGQFAPGVVSDADHGSRGHTDNPVDADSTSATAPDSGANATGESAGQNLPASGRDHSGSPAPTVTRLSPRWLGALAVAASVAALTIFAPGLFQSHDPVVSPELASTNDTANVNPVVTETGLQPVVWKKTGTSWQANGNRSSETHARRLNAMLVAHGEFSPAASMNGMAAYARFVSYDPERDEI